MSIYDSKLQSVIIHVTNACTNRCPYCYAYSENGTIKHADINKLYAIVDELKKADVKNIALLGGDPALYPHIVPLARYAKKLGISSSLMSNTMCVKGYSLSELIDCFSVFEATIHGANEEEHDLFCGNEGAYRKLVDQLKALSDLGAKIGIAINIIPDNAENVFEMIHSLCVNEGVVVNYIIIQRIIPFGRASNTTKYNLTKKLANTALSAIARIDEELHIKITVEDPFPLCVIEPKYKKYMHPCEWGFTKGALNGEGDISRCGADPRYLLGNIFETPLLDIWEKSDILRAFRKREYLSEECDVCPDKELCGGGCPLSCEVSGDHGLDYLYVEYKQYQKDQ